MPALFSKPQVSKVEDTPEIEPAALKAEKAKIQADQEKEKAKAARRVATILSGPGGVVEETQKALDGQAILLGSGKPLRKN